MIFNSTVFLIFFAGITLLFWLVRKNADHRNLMIVAASLLFYGWWDWRFVGLLLMTGALDFYAAQRIEASSEKSVRKRWLMLSLTSNFAALGFFKYWGFFVDSAVSALASFGIEASRPTLSIILPAGVSFYTFQALSYTVDVYRGTLKCDRNPIRYFAFLTFFPQLVAGPIERASFLLPQFHVTRQVTGALVNRGIWLILWGFFMKVVLADYLGPLVDLAFGSPSAGGRVVFLGTLAFGGQIYCDFAGYSSIALGVANTLGFQLSVNFSQPYLSGNIQEFWRRWHQTLSAWFRDYVYIPLGGDRRGTRRTLINVVGTFGLAGLWHGANWTYIIWGLCHGFALAVYRLWKSSPLGRSWTMPWPLGWLLTLSVVGTGWLFFRATSVEHAFSLLTAWWKAHPPVWAGTYTLAVLPALLAILGMDLFNRRCPWERVSRWPLAARVGIQATLLVFVVARWGREASPFIYFQF
jgi:alginate O-acetyltransferase complex protein AlgI